MRPGCLREHAGICFARLQRATRLLRIDFLVKRNPEAVVLDPSHTSENNSDVAQFEFDTVAAFRSQIAFGHHPAIREVAHAHTMGFGRLFKPDVSQQKTDCLGRDSVFQPPSF